MTRKDQCSGGWAYAEMGCSSIMLIVIQTTSHGIFQLLFERPSQFPCKGQQSSSYLFSSNSLKPCQASYTTTQQLFDKQCGEAISIQKHWTDACGQGKCGCGQYFLQSKFECMIIMHWCNQTDNKYPRKYLKSLDCYLRSVILFCAVYML